MTRRHRIRNQSSVKNTARGNRGYAPFLNDLKHRIQASQMKAALAVNEELIQLYWDIGRAIIQKQQQQGWGKSVVERLASDLKKAFPGISGFSASNIWRMRAFYQAYTHRPPILAQPVRELSIPSSLSRTRDQTMPHTLRNIPWGHNVILIQCLTDPAARIWYAISSDPLASPATPRGLRPDCPRISPPACQPQSRLKRKFPAAPHPHAG